MYSRLCDYRASVTVSDQHAWAILSVKDTLRGCDIVIQRGKRLLDQHDVITVLDEDFVNTPPAGPVYEGPVHEYDVLDSLRGAGMDCRRDEQQRSRD
jgi:hypothetical protein